MPIQKRPGPPSDRCRVWVGHTTRSISLSYMQHADSLRQVPREGAVAAQHRLSVDGPRSRTRPCRQTGACRPSARLTVECTLGLCTRKHMVQLRRQLK